MVTIVRKKQYTLRLDPDGALDGYTRNQIIDTSAHKAVYILVSCGGAEYGTPFTPVYIGMTEHGLQRNLWGFWQNPGNAASYGFRSALKNTKMRALHFIMEDDEGDVSRGFLKDVEARLIEIVDAEYPLKSATFEGDPRNASVALIDEIVNSLITDLHLKKLTWTKI